VLLLLRRRSSRIFQSIYTHSYEYRKNLRPSGEAAHNKKMIHPRLWGESVPYVCKGELLQTTLYAEHRRVVFLLPVLGAQKSANSTGVLF